MQLARKAKISDATVKFAETARHPPSRATLIRLIGVSDLKLSWADVPGQPVPPVADRSDDQSVEGEQRWAPSYLNCFLAPDYDSLGMIADLARFFGGAGGHVEQTNAYLDHYSAAAYLAICQDTIDSTELRARMPLLQAAKHIVAANESMHLHVLALGSGDGTLETRLVRHLVDEHASRIDLYLTDISQPLLNCAYRHAAESLAHAAQAHVWAVQCNFHHLPLYVDLCAAPTNRPQRRLFCLLGGTLANLDHEPRFLRQSLLNCQAGDLLLLDVQTISAACDRPEDIKRQDKLFKGGVCSWYAAWLAGPIWRHCKDVVSVDFHWNLDAYCPVPGSYALHAVATVKSQKRADRQFSVFRFTRYDPAKLALCLRGIGWEEIAALAYAGDHSLRLYQRRADRVERSSAASPK